MAKNQTFSVSLSLLTKNFQKGVKTVQTSLNSLKMQFRNFAAALGAGLGISDIARNMIDSARKLDKAQAVLKNVSNGVGAYADNQKFVLELSKKYNQELTTLMGNYAKYHATANQANIALEEQKYIYEALTRASAYFNLSADETNGVMLAITQMMSKGRVSSEELRRQLGERLPGAMGLMAKAMGVTNAELENMLKRGELLAVDALPKFAKELNKVTQNINVDNIEGASNKLRNAFTNLTTKLNIGGIYKNLINGVSNGLEYITNNLRKVGETIATVLGTIAMKPIIEKGRNAWKSFFNELEENVTRTQKRLVETRERANILAKAQNISIDSATLQPMGPPPVDPKALKSYERLKFLADYYSEQQKILVVQQEQLNNKLSTMGKRLGASVKNILKVVGIQAAYYAIAMAVSAIVTNIVSWYKEQKRIKNLVKETREELDKMADMVSDQETSLTTNLAVYNNEDAPESDRINALKRINELLGLEGDAAFTLASANEDVNKAVKDRIALIKEEQAYQSKLAKQTELQNRQKELEEERKRNLQEKEELREQLKTSPTQDVKMQRAAKMNSLDRRNKQIDVELGEIAKILKENGEELAKLELGASARQAELNNATIGNTGTGGNGGERTLIEEYKDIQEEYNTNLRTLNEMKKNELITEEEYNKALEELTLKTAESILALNDIDENTDTFAKRILDAAKAYIANAEKEDKMQDALDEYEKSVKELYSQYKNGAITQKELENELYSLLEETMLAVTAMGDLSGAAEKLADEFKKQKRQRTLDEIGKKDAPAPGKFDNTFNYRKEASEIYGDNAEYLRDYSEGLKEYIDNLKEYKDALSGDDLAQLNKYIDELETNLGTLTSQADTFAQAAAFAEVQEDIKNMKQELAEGIWDNITGIATAAERLTNSWKSLSDAMEDTDASGWEKFLTIFTTIITTIETIVSVYKTLQAAVAAYKALQLGMAAAEQAGIAVEVEKLALMTSQAVVAKQLAVAKGMQSAAAVPYPANIAAIASTAAALAAAFAAVPAFAQGGIVDSNSTLGDKNLIRVNGGEAILTKSQQGTLWKLLDGQTSMMQKGGSLELKVKGSDLVAVLNNYQKKISK